MRRNQVFVCAAVLLTSTTLLTGCSWFKKKPASPQGGQTGSGVNDIPGDGSGVGIGVSDRPPEGVNWDRTRFQAETVYFDFDSARVRPSELGKLETVAAGVKGGGSKLVIEGHADERGTSEYNRALAERRALACREELVRLGVAASSISTISYGEERPATAGHDEAAWSQNRRCDFGVVGQ